jgi:chromosome segregation ATPase
MENHRGDEPGRREEDRRWEKFQEQVMNLVTSSRTNQVALASLEKEVSKLGDHVEDVDDHLRGVAGKESLDTRVTVMEKAVFQNDVLLREISKKFGSLETLVREIKSDISTLKFHRAIEDKTDTGRAERFKDLSSSLAWRWWSPWPRSPSTMGSLLGAFNTAPTSD